MMVPDVVVKQPQINAAVSAVESELTPWVKHISFNIGQDWSGQWAIFFLVLLSDEAAEKRLKEVATSVVWRTAERLERNDVELFPYFEFRSESEQARRLQ